MSRGIMHRKERATILARFVVVEDAGMSTNETSTDDVRFVFRRRYTFHVSKFGLATRTFLICYCLQSHILFILVVEPLLRM